eukprot:g3574.t1
MSKNSKNFIFKGKLVIVGDVAVGKTSIVSRFIDRTFKKDQRSSIGVAYSTKVISIDPTTTVRFDLWDTAGQERFRSISSLFYRGAGAALMVCSLDDRKSFDSIKNFWLSQLRTHAPSAIIALAANKCDLSNREVSDEELTEFAEKESLIFYQTSAKKGINVDLIFGEIAKEVPKQVEKEGNEGFHVVAIDLGSENIKNIENGSTCC